MAHFQAITPDDASDLPSACSDFFVGGAGTLAVVAFGDTVAEAVSLDVPAGVLRLPWPVIRILASGTSASAIIGLGF